MRIFWKILGWLSAALVLPWIAVIGYLIYIGITQDAWITDQFFHWEGISFFLVPGFMFGPIGKIICDARAEDSNA